MAFLNIDIIGFIDVGLHQVTWKEKLNLSWWYHSLYLMKILLLIIRMHILSPKFLMWKVNKNWACGKIIWSLIDIICEHFFIPALAYPAIILRLSNSFYSWLPCHRLDPIYATLDNNSVLTVYLKASILFLHTTESLLVLNSFL